MILVPTMSTERTLLFTINGPDTVTVASNNTEDVISAFKQRIQLVGKNVPMLAFARASLKQCALILEAFPDYKRCFQESGNLVMLDL